MKQVTQIFWFLSAYKNYLYIILYSIKRAVVLCLKINTHALIKKYCWKILAIIWAFIEL